jgi:hypothetical protein
MTHGKRSGCIACSLGGQERRGSLSASSCYCSRPLSIPRASRGPSIEPRTGRPGVDARLSPQPRRLQRPPDIAQSRPCSPLRGGRSRPTFPLETAIGITSRPPEQASPQQIFAINRGHWSIENRCHYVIDWNYDEDRSRIRSGHGPENMSGLRRFAVGILHHFSDGKTSIAKKMRHLNRNIRLVFDDLRMSKNPIAHLSP